MKYLGWAIMILGLGYVGYILLESQDLKTRKNSERENFEQPVLIEGMDLYQYENNRLAWSFNIKNAEIYEKKKLGYLTDISGRIFSDNTGTKFIKVRAKKGVIDNNTQQMILKNKVYLALLDGREIETEYLVLDLKKEKIFNNHPVAINSEQGRIDGRDLNYDIKTSRLRLKQIDMGMDLDLD